jgi:hypothetical protein
MVADFNGARFSRTLALEESLGVVYYPSLTVAANGWGIVAWTHAGLDPPGQIRGALFVP